VTHDVPDFAVAVGNPARVSMYRFPPVVIEGILQNPWWEKDMEELREHLERFTRPYAEVLGVSEGAGSGLRELK
jgi:hypothetical protein